MKIRSKIKETLRPIVKEALSDYLRDTEHDLRAMQAAHPQLDIKKDLPSETGDFPIKENKTIKRIFDIKNRIKELQDLLKEAPWLEEKPGEFDWIDDEILHLENELERTRKALKKKKTVKEASTSDGAGPYKTPYAFSDVGLDKDVKKRKIAQQLGYKIVERNRLKEEVIVNVTKAVPIGGK